eukprot:TRINITY_DN525_c0_g1_i1.p1 TRINITY_DN525_c0_g1~~TRINITY_DN525_c0_g1_i1.p1  ORF type:complete len:374 (+),score=163.71 TRINITY_DN525_c0_g1_i1:209-1330(+)
MGNAKSNDGGGVEMEIEQGDVENPMNKEELGPDGEGVKGEGDSEDEEEETAAKDDSNLTKFDLKQREVNEELKVAKDCIVVVRRAEGKKGKKATAEGEQDEGTRAKHQFNRSLKSARRLFQELEMQNKADTATHLELKRGTEGKMPVGYTITDGTLKDRKLLLSAFAKQLDDVKAAMKQRATKRARPSKAIYVPPIDIELTEEEKMEQRQRLEASQPVEADQLADLPDLDPSSAAAYKEFCQKEEENQKRQEKILELVKVQTEQLEAISDESAKQDELCAAQGEALEEAIEVGKEANAAADEFLEEHGSGGCSKCKMACYGSMILIILGGGYYTYSNKDKLTSTGRRLLGEEHEHQAHQAWEMLSGLMHMIRN